MLQYVYVIKSIWEAMGGLTSLQDSRFALYFWQKATHMKICNSEATESKRFFEIASTQKTGEILGGNKMKNSNYYQKSMDNIKT